MCATHYSGFDGVGRENWHTEAEAPTGTKKMLSSATTVDYLTTVDGDTISAYAQWK